MRARDIASMEILPAPPSILIRLIYELIRSFIIKPMSAGVGARFRGPHRPPVGDDRGAQEDALRGRSVRVRRAAGRGVPARAAALPLSLLLHRPAQPQLV